MRKSPRKMNFYHNRHRSDGKLIEREERVTTSDFENYYTNTEKNLSNNTIQIQKDNEIDDEKYFEDSNKLINSMELLLESLQLNLNNPQKNISSSLNTSNNELYKEKKELLKEKEILTEKFKFLQSQNTPISTNNNINNNNKKYYNKLKDQYNKLQFENEELKRKIYKSKIEINKNKEIQKFAQLNSISRKIIDSMEDLKMLILPKNNFEDEFSDITSESKSNINDFYEGNYYNDESDEKEFEEENEDSRIREQDLYFKNNKIQKINSTREKNYKDYQILSKMNDRDKKQRNNIIPSPGDNYLYQNFNKNN